MVILCCPRCHWPQSWSWETFASVSSATALCSQTGSPDTRFQDLGVNSGANRKGDKAEMISIHWWGEVSPSFLQPVPTDLEYSVSRNILIGSRWRQKEQGEMGNRGLNFEAHR